MRKIAILLISAGSLPAQFGGYSGPAILSRGGGPANQRPAPLSFRPYVAVHGIYESGLTPVSLSAEGEVPEDSSTGVGVTAGAYLYHYWRRTLVGLDYRGAYYHHTRASYYNGTNQFATFIATHQPARRIQLRGDAVLGTYSRAFGADLGGLYGFSASSLIQLPGQNAVNELFDNRVYFVSSTGNMTYQHTARLSLNGGATAYTVRRRSDALVGVNGYAAHGDLGYRISRHSTLGLNYIFTNLDYKQIFGHAKVHMLGVNFARSLSRRWELGMLVSGYRLEVESVRQVEIDPVVAAIIGQARGREAFRQVNYLNGAGLRLSRAFRRASLTMMYTRGVNPGNGLILTSQSNTGSVSYSYTGLRRWSVSADAHYTTLSGVGQRAGRYEAAVIGGGFTRDLSRTGMHLVGRFDLRRIETSFVTLPQRTHMRVMLGFSFSPGDIPLSLW